MSALRHFILILWLTGALCGILNTAYGDDVEDDTQIWPITNINGTLHGNILGHIDIQPRIGNLEGRDHADSFKTLLIRPAVGYKVNDHLSLWQGYAWTPNFEGRYRSEHRLFQDALAQGNIAKLQVQNRLRFEQRFIDDAQDTSLRLRNMLFLTYPLGDSGKWSLIGYDEIFFTLNDVDNGPVSGFDQNRAFIGLSRRLTEHTSLQAGYIAQLINRPDPLRNRLAHILLLNLVMNF